MQNWKPLCLSQYGTRRHPDAKKLNPRHCGICGQCSSPMIAHKQGGTRSEAGPPQSLGVKSQAQLAYLRPGVPWNEMQRQHGAYPGRGSEGISPAFLFSWVKTLQILMRLASPAKRPEWLNSNVQAPRGGASGIQNRDCLQRGTRMTCNTGDRSQGFTHIKQESYNFWVLTCL